MFGELRSAVPLKRRIQGEAAEEVGQRPEVMENPQCRDKHIGIFSVSNVDAWMGYF